MARYYVSKEMINDDSNSRNSSQYQRLEEFANKMSRVKACSPSINQKLATVACRVIDNSDYPEYTREFVRDLYIHFSSSIYRIYLNDLSYDNELKELQMEVIRLLKYRVLTMRKLKYISLDDMYTALRNLNYGESMIFPRDAEH